MSAKNTYTNLIPNPNVTTSVVGGVNTLFKSYVVTGESESDNWNEKPMSTPIFATGAGAYSEEAFGFYLGKGVIDKFLLNAYPVESGSVFKLKMKVIGKNDGEIYDHPDVIEFNGKMDSIVLNYELPYEDNQVILYYTGSSNYPESLVRVRINIFFSSA